MARLTKAEKAEEAARWERITVWIKGINEGLGIDHGNALGVYAAKHGNKWPTQLADDFYSGRDANFRNPETGEHLGHFLRQIRNHPVHGMGFYKAV